MPWKMNQMSQKRQEESKKQKKKKKGNERECRRTQLSKVVPTGNSAPAESSNTPLQRKKQLHRNNIEKTNKAINSLRGPRFLRGVVEKHSINQRCCFHKSSSRAGGLGDFCFSPSLFVSSLSQAICIAIFVWQGVYNLSGSLNTRQSWISHETFYKN